MKKNIYLKIIFILCIFFIGALNVKAEELDVTACDMDDDSVCVGSGEGSSLVESGSKIKIMLSHDMPLFKNEEARAHSIKYTIGNNNYGCVLKSENPSLFVLSGDTFTVNPSDFDFIDRIGYYECTMPTTSTATKVSINVAAKSFDVNGSVVNNINETFNFAVSNVDYYNNHDFDITSKAVITIEGVELTDNVFYKSGKTNNASVNVNVKYNGAKCYYVTEFNDSMESSDKYIASSKKVDLDYGENDITLYCVTDEWKEFSSVINGAWAVGSNMDKFGDVNSASGSSLFMFKIIRNDTRSSVNTLGSLSISDVKISFKPEQKTYIATVPYKVSEVVIKSSLTDSKASYEKGFGNRTVKLNEGNNQVLIKVNAENGSQVVYTISINREVSDNNELKTISIGDKKIDVVEGTLKYTSNVNNDVENVIITAEAVDEKSKVEISEYGKLNVGKNEIEITVTAANGEKKIYLLNVVRDAKISSNASISKINIKGYDLKFNNEIKVYELTIAKESELDIEVIPEHEKATYLVTGNKDLKDKSIIKIKVTAEDGKSENIIQINIKKETNGSNLLLIIVGVASGIVILGVIVVLSTKKKNKTYASLDDVSVSNKNDSPSDEKTEVEEKKVEVDAKSVEVTTDTSLKNDIYNTPVIEPVAVEPVVEQAVEVEPVVEPVAVAPVVESAPVVEPVAVAPVVEAAPVVEPVAEVTAVSEDII